MGFLAPVAGIGGALKGVGAVAGIAGQLGQAGAASQAAATTRQITAINLAQINNQLEWKEWQHEFNLRNAANEVALQTKLTTLQTRMQQYQAITEWNLANRDAKALQLEAEGVRKHAGQNMLEMERRGYEATERVRGAFTKSGVVADAGTAAVVTDQQIRDFELQEQRILQQAIDRENQLKYAAANRRYEGQLALRFGQQQAELTSFFGHKKAFEMNRERNFMRLSQENEIRNMRIQAALTQLYGDQQAQAYSAQAGQAVAGAFTRGVSAIGDAYATRQEQKFGNTYG